MSKKDYLEILEKFETRYKESREVLEQFRANHPVRWMVHGFLNDEDEDLLAEYCKLQNTLLIYTNELKAYSKLIQREYDFEFPKECWETSFVEYFKNRFNIGDK